MIPEIAEAAKKTWGALLAAGQNQLKEAVAVGLNPLNGGGDVPVGIGVGGTHFQFLIETFQGDTKPVQMGFQRQHIRHIPRCLAHLLYEYGKFHQLHLQKECIRLIRVEAFITPHKCYHIGIPKVFDIMCIACRNIDNL